MSGSIRNLEADRVSNHFLTTGFCCTTNNNECYKIGLFIGQPFVVIDVVFFLTLLNIVLIQNEPRNQYVQKNAL